jgi:hypothetical protein
MARPSRPECQLSFVITTQLRQALYIKCSAT